MFSLKVFLGELFIKNMFDSGFTKMFLIFLTFEL